MTDPTILGRSTRLTTKHRVIFDRIFGSGGGYVLDFTDKSMNEWFREVPGIEIYQARFQVEGSSKGKILRGFVAVAEPRLVASVLQQLWIYRCQTGLVHADAAEEARLKAWLDQFTRELEQASTLNIEDAIVDFSGDTTLAKLRLAIATDLGSEKPDVALDRLHTYCVKRLRHILEARGCPVGANTPLDGIFGAYSRILRGAGEISAYALPALSVQHKLFDGLNQARNKRSLAHDTELLPPSEAQFITECMLSALAFIERIEAVREESSAKLDEITY